MLRDYRLIVTIALGLVLLSACAPRPTFTVTPAELEYAGMEFAQPATWTYTGPGTATIGAAVIGGPRAEDFQKTRDNCREARLTNGQNCVVEIELIRIGVGAATATVTAEVEGRRLRTEVRLF